MSAEDDAAVIDLRKTILVLSYIYYGGDGLPDGAQSPYSDAMYDNWARTLKTLQQGGAKVGFYDEAFADWGVGNNFSGLHLPRDEDIKHEALVLLEQFT